MKSKFKINFRYAIGEFLIVLISIISAFQLDAWKEERDNAKLVIAYLTDLEVGLNSDRLYYGRALKYFENIEQEMDSTQEFLKNKTLDLPASGQESLREFTDWYQVYVSNTAFEDLNNSGRLNLIKDKELRYNLIAYYQYIEFVKLLDVEYNQSLSRLQEKLLEKLDFQNPDFLKIPEEEATLIMNYLSQKQAYMRNYLFHRKTCQEINNLIRKKLANTIKKKN